MVSDPRSDDELVCAANAGDATAFDALYLRYRDWTLRVALRFTKDADEALDVLQDVWLYLLRKFPGFELTARLTTFLYPAVKHVALTRRARRWNSPGEPEALSGLADFRSTAGPTDDTRRELAAVLAALPASHAEVVLMRFVDDLSLIEIADALRIPVGTVKSRLHNALATLRSDVRTRRYFDRE